MYPTTKSSGKALSEVSSVERESTYYLPSVLDDFLWMTQMSKLVDLIVTLPSDGVVWPDTDHENLILATVFPFTNRRPWKYREPNSWLTVKGNCEKCEKKRNAFDGVICANF